MILGDGGVGKTSLVVCMASGEFSETMKMTIGLEVHAKELVVEGTPVMLQVMDFDRQDRFRFLLPRYCKQADGALFLLHLADWMEVISSNARQIPILCIGTKIDLIERRKVTRDEAIQRAQSFHLAGYAEVSAKTRQDVEQVFLTIAKLIMGGKGKEIGTLANPS